MKCRNHCGRDANGEYGYCRYCYAALRRWLDAARDYEQKIVFHLRHSCGLETINYR